MDKIIVKKKWPAKRIATYAGIGIFIFLILYTFVFGDHSRKLNVETERLTISTVGVEPFQEYIPVSGEVQPIQTYYLDVSEGGRVVEKFVEEGDFLEVGDPIIRLENPSLALSIMYNEAQVFQTMNSLRGVRLSMEQNSLSLRGNLLNLEYDIIKQKRIFNNNKKLYEKKLIADIEFEESKDDYEYLLQLKELTLETNRKDSLFRMEQIKNLEYNVSRMQKQLEMTQSQMENLTVRAPIRGQLTALMAEIGQSITGGQNLGRIDDIDNYKIRVQVDEHYLARIAKGQYGEFTFADVVYKLKIEKVYVQVDNGRFEVDMHFVDEVPTGIRRGQTVRIKLELGDLSEATTIARGGFFQTTGGQWIFVVDESGDFAVKRNISLGRKNTQVYEVLSGLEPGEKVITSSYDNYGDIEKLILNK
ncbi:MAG: efflux RND transporter periplasmic adaptor subunit [Melioribacteraceae bacterium]|nr:efflux RND transporter periplasmic adaptor subunit [Melioribacteraceae bacterium]